MGVYSRPLRRPGPEPAIPPAHQHDRADARHLLPGPREPPGRPTPTAPPALVAGHGGPRRHRLRVPVPERSRRRGRRHQGLPVPRSGPAAEQRQHDVGPERGCRHGPPPEHRLPVPDGAVLLVRRTDRGARLGRPAPLDRPGVDGGRRRRPLAAADARSERHRPRRRSPPGGRDGLPAQPLPAALRVAALGAPRGLGRAALAVRPDGQGVARRRLAMAGVVRRGAGPGREHQRQLARVRAPRTADLARVGPGHPAKRTRPGGRRRLEAGAAEHRRVAVVGGGPADPGRLRHRRPALHRVPRHRRRHLHGRRERPPARLLVLLRQRAGLPVHPAVDRVPGAPVAVGRRLRHPDARPGRGHLHPVALPGPGHGVRRDRSDGGRGRPSVGRAGAVRSGPPTVLRDVLGARPAVHASRHAAPGPGRGLAAGRRRRRGRPRRALVAAVDRRRSRGAARREPRAVVRRRSDRGDPADARGGARDLAGRGP